MNKALNDIQNQIINYKNENPNASVGELSDTYHSFNDLYKHRTLLLALALIRIPYAWRSRFHEDGSMYDGMFIVGAPTPDGMISYHCDNEYWNLFKIPVLPRSPHFDGYTDKDVLDRIEKYINSSDTKLVNANNIDRIERIVENDILPVFGNDMIKKAAFIGFYNE